VITHSSPQAVLANPSVLIDHCKVNKFLSTAINSRISEITINLFRRGLSDEHLNTKYFDSIKKRVIKKLEKSKPFKYLYDHKKLLPLIEEAKQIIEKSNDQEIVSQCKTFLAFLETKKLYGKDSFEFKITEINHEVVKKSRLLYKEYPHWIPRSFTLTLYA
jgi:hypothetical protein